MVASMSRFVCGWLFLLFVGYTAASHAEYDDALYLLNGDRLTGDIEALSRGDSNSIPTPWVRFCALERCDSDRKLEVARG